LSLLRGGAGVKCDMTEIGGDPSARRMQI